MGLILALRGLPYEEEFVGVEHHSASVLKAMLTRVVLPSPRLIRLGLSTKRKLEQQSHLLGWIVSQLREPRGRVLALPNNEAVIEHRERLKGSD